MCILATLPNGLPSSKLTHWDTRAYIYAGLFAIWWPGLYVMYTYMMKQRRKTIGTGFWGNKLTQQIAEKKRQ